MPDFTTPDFATPDFITPDFTTLVPDALGFLEDLAANNSRDWFIANKARFEAEVKNPAEALLAVLGAKLEAATGAPQTPKLYRIHRDLRFSKDKTPYNTHLHLQWTDKATGIGHFFGVARTYVSAGIGAMGFDKPTLNRWRDRIADESGAGFARLVDRMQEAGLRIDPPALKRVPAPYSQDHPRAALLKRKGIAVWHDLGESEQVFSDVALEAAFARMSPFRMALAEIVAPA